MLAAGKQQSPPLLISLTCFFFDFSERIVADKDRSTLRLLVSPSGVCVAVLLFYI